MGKRKYGSGSIRKRGRSLYLRYRAGGQDRRQVEQALPRQDRESMTAYRRRAEGELAKIAAGLASGRRQAPTQRTIQELAEDYLEWVQPGVKASTYTVYESQIRLYILPALGRVRVSRLETEAIQRFQRRLLQWPVVGGGPMAVSNARIVMGRLRDLLKHALDGEAAREYWGLSHDPWPQRHFRWPDDRERPGPRTHEPYTLAEAQRYVAAAPEELWPHVLCLLLLMLRHGELRAMRWAHLDWDERLYRVRETCGRHGFSSAKTAASEAAVPVPEVLIEALHRHQIHQANQPRPRRRRKRWQDQGLIFCTATGGPLPATQITARWHPRIIERAELRYVTVHTLRKTGATILEGITGVSREETQEALRHRRPTITDRYVAIDMEQRRRHVETLADLLVSFPQSSLKVVQS